MSKKSDKSLMYVAVVFSYIMMFAIAIFVALSIA
jgi:hypothetical protein